MRFVQMDVKTAFLNENLEETIYMQQPEGFIKEGQEHLVCKLKSIYGLKQAFGIGTFALIRQSSRMDLIKVQAKHACIRNVREMQWFF